MKLYFDENFSPHLIRGIQAFQAARPKEGIEVLSIKNEFGPGTPDEVWIPAIAQQHAVAITQDLNIQRLKHQWHLCEKYKVGMVFFQPPKKGWDYWTIVKLVVKLWTDICTSTKKANRPFAFQVSATAPKLKPLA